jgi:4'-phosphopantetheinyl transferase
MTMRKCLARMSIEDGSLDLWAATLDVDHARVDAYRAILDNRELARVDRLRREEDKRDYIVSHGILREVLGRYLDLAPRGVAFTYGPFGKPYVGEPGPERLEFNMSDSNGMLLIAVARGVAVGVDIEKHRPMEFLKFARRFFTEAEAAALAELAGDELQRAFFRIWTCKESYVKGWGYGIQRNVGKFEVSVAGGRSRLVRCEFDETAPDRWSLVDIDQIPRFAATVAIESPTAEHANLQWWYD